MQIAGKLVAGFFLNLGHALFFALELAIQAGVLQRHHRLLGDPTLWHALNGRFASVVRERFGSPLWTSRR